MSLRYFITRRRQRRGDDVYQVLQLIQRAVACPKVIGGVAQLTATGGFKEFNSVINVELFERLAVCLLQERIRNRRPSADNLSSLRSKRKPWKQTYSTASSRKQLEFIEEAPVGPD